ncbi:MAG: UvrB/UvrC motif-containing protein, partial [Planctomycetes bacterium]|nr:UvrB/UvrC motif-containing protein [Planctomycetota bacterium]
TGLVDPQIEVRSATGQVEDLLKEMKALAERGERMLVTTLTKRLAEDLSEYFAEEGISSKYLHCEIETLERIEILRDLRLGKFDVLVGVNLLREGLDLPEVSMVAILDADREGFLRSETSLIQMIGRCARNVNAKVLLYAEDITKSMRKAIDETNRRREIQIKFNEEHNIQPQTIRKAIREGIEKEISESRYAYEAVGETEETYVSAEHVKELEEEMQAAAEGLEFERAAELRDRILKIKGEAPIAAIAPQRHGRRKRGRRRKVER